mgnify:CR=1 FL=1
MCTRLTTSGKRSFFSFFSLFFSFGRKRKTTDEKLLLTSFPLLPLFQNFFFHFLSRTNIGDAVVETSDFTW